MGDTTETSEKQGVHSFSAANSFFGNGFGGISMVPPMYGSPLNAAPTQLQADTQQGHFGDTENRIRTQSGLDANNPVFDPETMRDVVSTAEFTGAGDEDLRIAMIVLQGSHDGEGNFTRASGQELEEALITIARVRGIELDQCRSDFERAMTVKEEGERHARENGHDSVSPTLDTTLHPDFMGSTSQLRFGMTMGDVFGVDPVFGALISPTGGAVGPGNDSISDADKNNGTVMHGTVHDAAGYLLNAHGIGPGYNYLGDEYELFDTTNPLAGQLSGTSYWTERDQVSTFLSILGTYVTNIPSEGFGSDNITRSGVDVAEGNGITGFIDGARGLASDAWNGISGLASDAWGGIQSGWDTLSGWAGNAWDGAKGLASDAWDSTTGAASDAWNGAKGLASDAWGGITSTASDAWGATTDAASDAWGGVTSTASDAWSGIQNGWNNLPWAQEQQHDHGSQPVGNGISGPYAYNSQVDGGYMGGFGVGGLNAPGNSTSILSGDYFAGATPDPDGGTRYGIGGSVGGARGNYNLTEIINSFAPGTVDESVIMDVEAGLGTAAVDAWLNPDSGFSLSAQANLAEIAATFGTSDNTSHQDRQARFGLSEGVGAAVRGHWGDSDGDGYREFGFGGDFGPVSFDVKTEDPLRDVLGSLLPGGPMMLNTMVSPDSNLSHEAWDQVVAGANQAWDTVSGLASDAWGGAQNLYEGASTAAGNAWDATSSAASNAWNGATDMAGQAWDATTNAASNAWNGATNMAGNAWDATTGAASNAWNTTTETAGAVVDGVSGLASDAWGATTNAASSAYDTVSSGASSLWEAATGWW